MLLVASLQRGDRAKYERAYKDAHAIQVVADGRDTVLARILADVEKDAASTVRRWSGPGSAELILPSTLYFSSSKEGEEPSAGMLLEEPLSWGTLSAFETFWNQTHAFYRPTIPATVGLRCSDGELLTIHESSDPSRLPTMVFELGPHKDKGDTLRIVWNESRPTGHRRCASDPIPVSPVPRSVRRLLANEANMQSFWGVADFAAEFPDLNMAAEGFKEIPLEYLVSFLQRRMNERSGDLDLWGLKLPIATFSRIGPLVLILCQLYFSLHFGELLRRLRQAQPAAWPSGFVLLYENAPARLFSVVVTALLPCISIFVSFLNVLPDSTWRSLAVLVGVGVLLASGSLSLWACLHLRTLKLYITATQLAPVPPSPPVTEPRP